MCAADRSILVSDVDTVWMKNPLPYMAQYPQADVLTSSDHVVHAAPPPPRPAPPRCLHCRYTKLLKRQATCSNTMHVIPGPGDRRVTRCTFVQFYESQLWSHLHRRLPLPQTAAWNTTHRPVVPRTSASCSSAALPLSSQRWTLLLVAFLAG